ncbi:MAG: SsrA-binding protein SmpB [Defluviitaleaceae bacterium]|nr:SsrA-binding protein SmpB [Defluviitaleaceae bacterium]
MPKDQPGVKLISSNKKAYFEYFIEETFQAGIELVGTEVKSLRQGMCNLRDSYVRIEGGQAFLENMHVSPYEKGNIFNKDPLRRRRLLLHKAQIRKIHAAAARDGFTIIPTRIYLDRSLVKIDIAIAKGKKLYDKRESIAKKDQQRDAARQGAAFRG